MRIFTVDSPTRLGRPLPNVRAQVLAKLGDISARIAHLEARDAVLEALPTPGFAPGTRQDGTRTTAQNEPPDDRDTIEARSPITTNRRLTAERGPVFDPGSCYAGGADWAKQMDRNTRDAGERMKQAIRDRNYSQPNASIPPEVPTARFSNADQEMRSRLARGTRDMEQRHLIDLNRANRRFWDQPELTPQDRWLGVK